MTLLLDTPSKVSILEFMAGIFGRISEDAKRQPVLCGFTDDPGDCKKWIPQSIKGGKLPHTIHRAAKCYFSLASFLPDDYGKYRAKKEHVAAIHAILLDDIGTKAKKKLPIRPSWKIETSPGNYQVGLILKSPCKDIEKYEAVVKGLGKLGWSDPGASGAARWTRLPSGVNTKAKYLRGGTAPMVKLVEFRPEKRYSLKKISEAFGLEAIGKEIKFAKSSDRNSDPVLLALKAAGLWKSECEPGKHDITCPWVIFHTDQKDHGTVYYEPSSANKRSGGFICQHGHCSGRGIADLEAYLDISNAPQRKGSVVEKALRIVEEEIRVFLDEHGEPFGLVDRNCLPLKSREVKGQILRNTHLATGEVLKKETVNEVLATLESKRQEKGTGYFLDSPRQKGKSSLCLFLSPQGRPPRWRS